MTEPRRCPRCTELLSVSEFGICRARKDGLNLYCKSCIRKRISLSRQMKREYNQARDEARKRQQGIPEVSPSPVIRPSDFSQQAYITRTLMRLPPTERVREAIRMGARTQKQIIANTKLSKDQVGDALADLLLWTKEVMTLAGSPRQYFLRNDETNGFKQPAETGAPVPSALKPTGGLAGIASLTNPPAQAGRR